MKGGVGSAAVASRDGLTVAALVAVNAFGDVIDPATGRIVAGVRGPTAARSPTRGRCCAPATIRFAAGNTTLGVVATNADADEDRGDARRADGARRLRAGHRARATRRSTATRSSRSRPVSGRVPPTSASIGALAAEVMADAIVRGGELRRHRHCLGHLAGRRADFHHLLT